MADIRVLQTLHRFLEMELHTAGLQARYVPTSQSGALLQKIMNNAEARFGKAVGDSSETGIPTGYFGELQIAFRALTTNVQNKQPYKCTTSTLIFQGEYIAKSNTYEISKIQLRPCVWETGIIRQLTDAAVQGAKANGTAVRFLVGFGTDYFVTLTMDENKGLFVSESAIWAGGLTYHTYTLDASKFGAWDDMYGKIDARLKDGWSDDDLMITNADRFKAMDAKFNKFSPTIQKLIAGIIPTR
jgi:hypothetical protein